MKHRKVIEKSNNGLLHFLTGKLKKSNMKMVLKKNILLGILFAFMGISQIFATDNPVTLGGGGSNQLRINVKKGGIYCIYRNIGGTWQKQLSSENSPMFAIKIGNTTFSSGSQPKPTIGTVTTLTNVEDIGTPVTNGTQQEMTKKFTGNYNGKAFSVTLKITYNTSSPNYFIKTATIDASNIPSGTQINLAYGWDTYVNGGDQALTCIIPDANHYNGWESQRLYWFATTAQIRTLRLVGAMNINGNGSLMGFFPIGRSFDRARSDDQLDITYCYNFVQLTSVGNGNTQQLPIANQSQDDRTVNVLKFGPYYTQYAVDDNGISVGYDAIPAGQITEIKTGVTFSATLDGELDYTWDNSKSKTANIGDNVNLKLNYVSYNSARLTNIGFRANFTGLSTTGGCSVSGFSGGTSTCTSGNDYYQISGATVNAGASASVNVPVKVTCAGQWVVDGNSITNTSQTLPIGTPATLTVATTVSLADNTAATIGKSEGKQFTVKFPGSITAAQDVTINLTYSGNTGDFSSMPATVTIPAGQNSATFTVTASSSAVDGRKITITLSGTDKVFATVDNPKSVDLSIKNCAVPTLNDMANQTLCAGATQSSISFTGSNVDAAASTWTNNNTAIGLGASGTGNIPSFTTTNNTSSAITATITVTPTSNSGGCSGATKTFTITVNPTVATPTLTHPNLVYWQNETVSNLATAAGASAASNCTLKCYDSNGTVVTGVNTSTTGQKTYYINQKNNNTNCESGMATVNILVIATQDASYMTCPGGIITLDMNPISGVSFYWYSASTGGSALSGSPSNTYTASNVTPPQTFWVEARTASTTFTRKSIDITLNPVCGAPATCLTGGVLLYKEDFGGNNTSDPDISKTNLLPAGATSLPFFNGTFGSNGNTGGGYGLTKNAKLLYPVEYWQASDHTYPNDVNRGYLMGIDVASKFLNEVVYQTDISGLCDAMPLSFSAWIMKINSVNVVTPKIEMQVVQLNNNIEGNVLATTGVVAVPHGNQWQQYSFGLTLPAGVHNVRFKIINKEATPGGNDLGIDDIEVRACLPSVSLVPGDATVCAGSAITLQGAYQDNGNFGNTLIYSWEHSLTNTTDPNAWTTKVTSAAGTGTLNATYPISSVSATDTGYYRLWVSNTASVMYSNCRAISTPVKLRMNALPVVSITGSNSIFENETTQLSPTTGGTWTSSNTTVATVSNSGLVTGKKAGTATFTFESTSTGCSATTNTVTIKERKITVMGTVFPYVHWNMNEYDKLFPITVTLKSIPNPLATNPLGDLTNEVSPLSTEAIYYDGSTFVPNSPKSPGIIGALNNYGLPIDWNDAIHADGGNPVTAILQPGEKPTTISGQTLGLFKIENVTKGDYILEIKRDGYVTRWAKIYVNPDQSVQYVGHRELLPGDIDQDIMINLADIAKMKLNIGGIYTVPATHYNSKYDLNADGMVNQMDFNLILKFSGFWFYHYEETLAWLEELHIQYK